MALFSSVRNKIMVPTLFITVSLLTLLGVSLALNSYSGFTRMLKARADSNVDFLAKISISSYKNFEYFDLDTIVDQIMKDPEVDFAVFSDARGTPLTKAAVKSTHPFIEVERKIFDESGKPLGLLKLGLNRSIMDSYIRNSLQIISVSIVLAILLFVYGIKTLSERVVVRRLEELENLSEKLADGDMTITVNTAGYDEISSLGRAMNKMAANLRESIGKTVTRNTELEDWQKHELWLKSGLNDLNIILRGEHTISELADEALAFVADFLGAGVGVIYLYFEKGEMLQTLSTYAISRSKRLSWGFALGEGLPGQVALERKMIYLDSVPPDYLVVTSPFGKAEPLNVVIMPIMYNNSLVGVLELGSFKSFSEADVNFLKQALEGVAIAMQVSRSRLLVSDLLTQTQLQTEELRAHQEELQQSNEELTERTRMLENPLPAREAKQNARIKPDKRRKPDDQR